MKDWRMIECEDVDSAVLMNDLISWLKIWQWTSKKLKNVQV